MEMMTDAYRNWLKGLKANFRLVQQKAAVTVNQKLLMFYWELGKEIVDKEVHQKWGSGFLKNLSRDLSQEFKEIKGFSKRNLELVRKWYLFWSPSDFAKQAVSQLENTQKIDENLLEMIKK
jgi:hypothetical protein